MALLLKSRDGDPSVGSNPTASERYSKSGETLALQTKERYLVSQMGMGT